jgi:hypothetical protein
MDAETGAPNVSLSSVRMLHAMIKEWNLTDDLHRVAEISERTIALLPMNYVTPILDVIDQVSKKGAVANPLASSTSATEPS